MDGGFFVSITLARAKRVLIKILMCIYRCFMVLLLKKDPKATNIIFIKGVEKRRSYLRKVALFIAN